jgi:hypothetical protein
MNTSIGMQEQDVQARRGDWIEELVAGLQESVGEERPRKRADALSKCLGDRSWRACW